jgi:hypothetical protein
MSRLLRETGTDSLRPVRRLTAAVAIALLGRVLTGAAVDAFLFYVLGNPATERRRARVVLSDDGGPVGRPHVHGPGEVGLARRRAA